MEEASKEGAQPNMISVMKGATNPSLSDEEIRDEIFTIRGAGHETTSNVNSPPSTHTHTPPPPPPQRQDTAMSWHDGPPAMKGKMQILFYPNSIATICFSR
jgi:hypothetical protein